MANRTFDDLQVLGKGVKVLHGSFKCAGNQSPSVTQGTGFSVSRATAGTYSLVLSEGYVEIVTVLADAERDDATTAIFDVNVKRANGTSSTITIQTYTDDGDGTGTVEDIAAGSNNGNWVHFVVLAKNTKVGNTIPS